MILDGALFALGVATVAAATYAAWRCLARAWARIRYTRIGWWLWRRRWPSRPERW